jgi:hypothetical protein
MQMLGILVPTQIGDNPTSAVIAFDLCSHLTHYIQQTVHYLYAKATEIGQRGNVDFGNDNYVNAPMGARVMKRQHVVSLHDNLDRSSAAQCLIAIEVAGHVNALMRGLRPANHSNEEISLVRGGQFSEQTTARPQSLARSQRIVR